ncbi:MAG: hypothetical protein LBF24_00410 [Puniceicoccales bacterium]|jgi:hypothetical protein|nr:hypothetical protein [Puniceicoccales bacterium]
MSSDDPQARELALRGIEEAMLKLVEEISGRSEAAVLSAHAFLSVRRAIYTFQRMRK